MASTDTLSDEELLRRAEFEILRAAKESKTGEIIYFGARPSGPILKIGERTFDSSSRRERDAIINSFNELQRKNWVYRVSNMIYALTAEGLDVIHNWSEEEVTYSDDEVQNAIFELLEMAQKSGWKIGFAPASITMGPQVTTANGAFASNLDRMPLLVQAFDIMLNDRQWLRLAPGSSNFYTVAEPARQALAHRHTPLSSSTSGGVTTLSKPTSNRVFIVHGHDEKLTAQVARVIEQLGLEPIILKEQPSRSATIVEKFEKHAAEAGFAVVCLTPDDEGFAKSSGSTMAKDRARQNVVMELGYFMGKLGRDKVCALHSASLELPSDIHGVVYVPVETGDWKYALGKELRAAGYDVDLNKL